MEEGYIQMANVLHQRPSTALESSNLVCKSMRIKCNPDTWVLCLQTLHSIASLSLPVAAGISGPAMKMETERPADGQNL